MANPEFDALGAHWTPFDGSDRLARFLNHPATAKVFGIMGVLVSIYVAARFLHPGISATGVDAGPVKL
jgi:hypothetical protein